MELDPKDLVEIIALPSRIEPAERPVYRACLGLKLVVLRVDADGAGVFQLHHQEWSHFPGITPFELRFEPACLRKIEPFSDAEWAALSAWMEHDASIPGEVIAVGGTPAVRLEGGIVAHLALPEDGAEAPDPGTTVGVRIIVLNRNRRDLVVCPT